MRRGGGAFSPGAGPALGPDHLGGKRECERVFRTFEVSRATLYRWRKRFDPYDPTPLEERTRQPRRVRNPIWSAELVQAVLRLREQYPRWGKGKAGGPASSRGPAHLGFEGGPHPGRSKAPGIAGRAQMACGERKAASGAAVLRHAEAQGLCARLSRDLVQVETLELSLVPGVSLK